MAEGELRVTEAMIKALLDADAKLKEQVAPFLGEPGSKGWKQLEHALQGALQRFVERSQQSGLLMLPEKYDGRVEFGSSDGLLPDLLKQLHHDLASYPGFADLLKGERGKKELEDPRLLKPRSKMVLHDECAEYLGYRLLLAARPDEKTGKIAPYTLWYGCVQIGERTESDRDTIYLAQLVTGAPEDKHKVWQVALKGAEEVPGRDKDKIQEWRSGHFRLVHRLAKYRKELIKSWNGIDPKWLTKQQCWNEAGCFLGFYLIVPPAEPATVVMVSAALNRYAGALFGDEVPLADPRTLSRELQLAWQHYCITLQERRKPEPDNLAELKQTPGHRFHLGATRLGSSKLPRPFAARVAETLRAWDLARAKKK